MFIYIFVPILLTLLAVSFPKMGPRSKSLSISLTTLLLFVIVAFRGRYVDHDYRLAYEAYCKERRYKHPATLYGHTAEGEISVIFSKA